MLLFRDDSEFWKVVQHWSGGRGFKALFHNESVRLWHHVMLFQHFWRGLYSALYKIMSRYRVRAVPCLEWHKLAWGENLYAKRFRSMLYGVLYGCQGGRDWGREWCGCLMGALYGLLESVGDAMWNIRHGQMFCLFHLGHLIQHSIQFTKQSVNHNNEMVYLYRDIIMYFALTGKPKCNYSIKVIIWSNLSYHILWFTIAISIRKKSAGKKHSSPTM